MRQPKTERGFAARHLYAEDPDAPVVTHLPAVNRAPKYRPNDYPAAPSGMAGEWRNPECKSTIEGAAPAANEFPAQAWLVGCRNLFQS